MRREQEIVSMLERHRYLDTGSLAKQLFPFPTGEAKCQQVMARMTKNKLVKRFRLNSRSKYIYHLGARSAKWQHWLDLNRFHFGIIDELKSWQKILFWDHEVSYPGGIADAFYIIRTTIDGGGLMFYLEMDDGNNKFDKVQKYMAYFQSQKWKSEWWAQGGNGHPLVLIVTPRAREIGMIVSRSGVDYIVATGKNQTGYLKLLQASVSKNVELVAGK